MLEESIDLVSIFVSQAWVQGTEDPYMKHVGRVNAVLPGAY